MMKGIKIFRISQLLFVICLNANLYSQTEEDIITDRPDQTEAASTVPGKHVQFEFGGTFEEDISDRSSKVQTISIPSLLVRYGISNKIELRFGTEYSNQKISDSERKFDGLSPIYLGTKLALLKENDAIPQTALILGFLIPYYDGPTQPEKVGAEFRFTMKHTLNERFSLSYNLGGEWNGDDKMMTGLYTLAFGISLADKVGMYVESYGFYKNGSSADNRLDGGFTYLLKPNVQFDISGGYGINEDSPDYFAGLGLSFRLPN